MWTMKKHRMIATSGVSSHKAAAADHKANMATSRARAFTLGAPTARRARSIPTVTSSNCNSENPVW